MRLDKLLSNMGAGSRKEVKLLLKAGAIQVDGEIVRDPKQHVDVETQQVLMYGEPVTYQKYIYLMMNKPPGVISATEDKRDETVIDLLFEDVTYFKPFPVGRLDKDTEGLLLLTNDGAFNHALMSPKKHVEKTYYAEVTGVLTQEDVEAIAAGVTLEDGYQAKPGKLVILSTTETDSTLELTITEGKFHQVKRMMLALGKEVTFLKRRSIGRLELDPALALGDYRELTPDELSLFDWQPE
ncbi:MULTISPECIES: pseudouridine synthase [Exiguobacterium]|uniref:pseudouridine synthase n=1 Tax=Exiguobacterium TaxID=33986 RepID=UPI0007D79D84|nr:MULTISPECIES: pseudouridine synthase [Exiguobacterium]MBF8152162.1 rRNA pseudouridine synthase [Exiguobacterium sp. TBG-PICH-001]OAI89060.1 16S rRNA pseudouridine(516) synthase [Exiguobacterium sp. KKBO11]QZY86087.1 rRNA pseudouridine synthase [Exiguobacterium acetylicum]